MSDQDRRFAHDPTGPELAALMNLWGPYTGAGIRVVEMTPDWKRSTVELKLTAHNRNFFGTHFGGSLSSMTNPHYVLMLAGILGRGYVVWDIAQTIRFLKPGRGTVTARFELTDAQIEEVRTRTADGAKFEPRLTVNITDEAGDVVASVEQTLYVRKQRPVPAPE